MYVCVSTEDILKHINCVTTGPIFELGMLLSGKKIFFQSHKKFGRTLNFCLYCFEKKVLVDLLLIISH